MDEHLSYEIGMLKYTYNQIRPHRKYDTIDNNVYLECFAIHARCLLNWMNTRLPKEVNKSLQKIDDQILTYPGKRMDTQAGKFDPEDWDIVYNYIEKKLPEFDEVNYG